MQDENKTNELLKPYYEKELPQSERNFARETIEEMIDANNLKYSSEDRKLARELWENTDNYDYFTPIENDYMNTLFDIKGNRSQFYNNLAGEVEARNVMNRMDFTPEERLKNLPLKTQDVMPNETILLSKSNRFTLPNKNLTDYIFEKTENVNNKDNKNLYDELTRKDTIQNLWDKRKDWGIAFTKASGNPKLAIKTLRENEKGFVPNAFYKEGIGDIDLPWGVHDAKTGKGYGLKHIIERRKAQGIDVDKFLDDLPKIIKRGVVTTDKRYATRKNIEDLDNRISIELNYNGNSRKWVVTAFKINKK